MADEPLEQVRQRFRQARVRTADREGRLSEDDFLCLPERLQNQLAVLQSQCEEPLDDNREALAAVEHNLKSYNAKLEQALDLVAQLGGARRRQESDRTRGMVKTVLVLGVLVALLGGGWLGYQHVLERKDELCKRSAPCALRGQCAAGLTVELPLVELACQAGSDEDCRSSRRCAESAECYASLGRCVARADKDCKKTPSCLQDGACTAREGRCVAATRDNCLPTAACKEHGKCSPGQGICVVAGDEDCKHSLACKRHGACTEVQGQCVRLAE